VSANNNNEKLNHPGGFHTEEWAIDPPRNLLARGTEQVRLEPRVMDVRVECGQVYGSRLSPG